MATHASPAARGGLAGQGWRRQPLVAGAISGIAGGIVFGMMMAMAMPQVLPMIGSLLGVPALGWGVHLLFSAIIGAGFGLAVGDRFAEWTGLLGAGLGYGFLWWILGPLLIMPIWLGMGPMLGRALDAANLMSLMGHLVYGLVTAAVYKGIHTRAGS